MVIGIQQEVGIHVLGDGDEAIFISALRWGEIRLGVVFHKSLISNKLKGLDKDYQIRRGVDISLDP